MVKELQKEALHIVEGEQVVLFLERLELYLPPFGDREDTFCHFQHITHIGIGEHLTDMTPGTLQARLQVIDTEALALFDN